MIFVLPTIGHEALIRDMRFSREHNVLLSCSFDRSVRLWSE